jgi:hypothetical protein
MHGAIQHFVLLIFAVSVSAIGWFIARNPDRAYRFFTFGMRPEQKFFVGFCRIVGWCFAVFFAAGAFMYITLIFYDLVR